MTTTFQFRVARRSRSARGFSLIEVLFAIGMLGIGIVGVLSLFTTGISTAAWSKNLTSAAMEAQSLYTRVVSEVDAKNERLYLKRINDPKNPTVVDPDNEWIHTTNGGKDPVKVDQDRDVFWQCRVSKKPMDPDFPLDSSKDKVKEPTLPLGLYQIAIAVYRNWQPGKEPIVTYTTFVTAGY